MLRLIVSCIGILLLAYVSPRQGEAGQSVQPIARIGQQTISLAAWNTRTELLRIDSMPQAESYALYQLLKMYCYEAIAQKYGYPLTDTMLQAEAKRIDSTTLMPDRLQQIKALCGSPVLYQEVFVKESLYPRWLKVCFDRDEKQHRNKAEQATALFTRALLEPHLFASDSCLAFWLDPNHLQPVLKMVPTADSSAAHFIDQTKKQNTQVQMQVESQMQTQENAIAQQLYQLVRKLKEGQLHPRVLEMPQAFWILKHCGQDGEKYKINVLEIPKNDFSQWIEQEIRQIEVEIMDSIIWNKMVATIPVAQQLFLIRSKK